MKMSKIIFMLLILTNIIGVTFVANNRYKELLANEQEILQSHAERLKQNIESQIMVTDILDQVIQINHGTISEEDFYDLAEVLATRQIVSSIAYIPDGVIKYLYPPEAGKRVVGNNVFTSKNDSVDSKKARDTKEVVISGPYELFQGTDGIVIRNPVYYNDEFWGIVTVALDARDLFEYVGLGSLERQGYEFQLATEKILATQSSEYSSTGAVTSNVKVGSSAWNFSLYVKDKTNIVVSDVMFWFLIFLFLNFILYYLIQRFESSKEKLAYKLEHDQLTGAYSRLKLQKYYDESKHLPFALFFLDLNKFKPVNDTYGHKVGDKLLQAFAERLKNEMQAETLLVRLGGDEFVVVTPHVGDVELAETIKRKIITLSEIVFLIDSHQINISASIGYVFSSEADNLENLLTLADSKMYAEKGDRAR